MTDIFDIFDEIAKKGRFADLPCERKDCQLVELPSTTTTAFYPMVYDRAGNRIDSGDQNTTFHEVRCQRCLRLFGRRTKAGVTSPWTEAAPAARPSPKPFYWKP